MTAATEVFELMNTYQERLDMAKNWADSARRNKHYATAERRNAVVETYSIVVGELHALCTRLELAERGLDVQ